jgi:hypothetical protein
MAIDDTSKDRAGLLVCWLFSYMVYVVKDLLR